MWARVQYEIDQEKMDVPISFFKDHEVVVKELENNVRRPEYKVFWSKKSSDTPAKMLKEQGRIIDVEKIIRGKKSGPITGYYNAKLIQFAGSLKELLALFEEPKGRRPLKPNANSTSSEIKKQSMKGKIQKENKSCSEKARQLNLDRITQSTVEETESSQSLTNMYKSESEESNPDNLCDTELYFLEKQDNSSANDAKNLNTSSTFASISPNEKKRKKPEDNSFSVEFENVIKKLKEKDKLIETLYLEKKEDKKWKNDFLILQQKHKDLQEQFNTLLKLNTKWQEKELSRHKSQSSHRSSSHNKSSHHSIEEQNTHKLKDDDIKKNPMSSSKLPIPFNHDLSGVQCSEMKSKHEGSNNFTDIEIPAYEDNNAREIKVLHIEDLTSLEDNNAREIKVLHIEGATLLEENNSELALMDNSILPNTSQSKTEKIINTIDNHKQESTATDKQTKLIVDLSYLKKNSDIHGPACEIQHARNIATVSQAQFDKINKIDVGPKGDGKFVKKLADLLWNRQELFNRSASGKPCPNKDDSEARPACSPLKKTYIRDLMKARIRFERMDGKVSQTELNQRLGSINKHIASKIKTIRNSHLKSSTKKENNTDSENE